MIHYAGSAQSYAKSLNMQWIAKKKWDEKSGKTQSLFSSSTLTFGTGIKISQTDGQSTSGINTEEVDYRLSQIVLRLKRGKKLSTSELDYLRRKDPKLYQKALRIEQEREEYEKELKKCKTKEDVRKANMVRLNMFIPEVSKAQAENDLDAATDIEMRFNSIKDAHETFVNSRSYARLPENQKELAKRKNKAGRARAEIKLPKDEKYDADQASEVLTTEKENNAPLPETGENDAEEKRDMFETPEKTDLPEVDSNETDEKRRTGKRRKGK